MAKPKRTNNLNSKRPARPQQSEIHTPKPHRKGGAPESRATGKRSDAAQGYESEFQRDGSKERRTKKRWEDETPSVRAMREQIRDAAAKAAGHPPIRKHAKSSGSKSFEGQRPYGIDRPFEGRPTGRNHRDDDSSFEPRRGIRKLNASDSSFDPQSSGRNHRDDDRRFDSRPSGRGSRDMEAPRVEQSPVDAPKKALRPKHVKADEQPVAEAVVAVTPVAENAPETEQDNAASQGPTFDDLGLSDALRASVAKAGYETPTPIQAGGIPILLQGRDLIGQAQTGTGKTAAYALPAIQLVDPEDWSTQVIILAPTRELAVQVATETQAFAFGTGVRVTAVYGGQPIDRQFRALKNGAQIVVGTPGRVLDHMRRETLSLASVKLCVLDEADEMLALGFLDEVESILSELPPERQTALLSATMQDRVMTLSKKYLNDPLVVQIENKRRTVDTTKQTYYDVVPGKKQDAIARVLDMEDPGPTIVFCRTRMETEELAEALRIRGYAAEALNGDMGQVERERVLRRFRDGQADLLIATDVAARGLDIETVTHVINYDIPWDVEQYIHRIGRTGRAGRTGDAITLVEPRQRRQLFFIEQQIGVRMTPARVPTSADIAARRRQRFIEALTETLDTGDYEAYLDVVSHLSDTHDPSDVAAAALKMLWKTWSTSPEEIGAGVSLQEERTESGMVRIFIGAGRFDGLRPRDIIGALTHDLGLNGRSIGAIDILDKTAFVEVPASDAPAVVESLGGIRFRGQKAPVSVAKERR